jgi:hypothetical protein
MAYALKARNSRIEVESEIEPFPDSRAVPGGGLHAGADPL